MTKVTVRHPLPTKREIRSLIRSRFADLSDDERDARSEEACRSIYETYLRDADPMRVGLFLSMPGEVQTTPLVRDLQRDGRHRILIPRCDDKETIRFYPMESEETMKRSKYGILEPSCPIESAEVPEFVVVPGVAFSKYDAGRVGHGAGYYDRYLSRYHDRIRFAIGLALGFQMMDRVPTDPHDYPLDAVAWEGNVVVFEH
jgi:5-formyltetrahydrofolate cyclo-ligase